MATFDTLNAGDVISFETVAPGILPQNYKGVRFEGGPVGWRIAKLNGDIASTHRRLYPTIRGNGVKDDYRSYNYIIINVNDELVPLGLPWIKEESLVLSGSKDETFVFSNLSADNKNYLIMLLKANGFTNFYQP